MGQVSSQGQISIDCSRVVGFSFTASEWFLVSITNLLDHCSSLNQFSLLWTLSELTQQNETLCNTGFAGIARGSASQKWWTVSQQCESNNLRTVFIFCMALIWPRKPPYIDDGQDSKTPALQRVWHSGYRSIMVGMGDNDRPKGWQTIYIKACSTIWKKTPKQTQINNPDTSKVECIYQKLNFAPL